MNSNAEKKIISDYSLVQLPELPLVPGMISENESKYLYWLTSEVYTGKGAVVEVGTWLGKSSAHLGAGLRDSSYPNTLYCHDLYFWHRNFNAPHLVAQSGLELEHGTDFQPYFEKNVRPIYDNLVVAKGPLDKIKWDNGPIEILFIDAPKDQKSICVLLEIFASHLIPGVSTVIMQDFLHAPSYPLALVFSELSEELEFVHAVPNSSTAVFHLRKALMMKRGEKRFKFLGWSKEKLLGAWSDILDKLPTQPRDYMEPGVAMSLSDIGEIEAACTYIRDLELGPEGEERWGFLRNVPHYYERYQEIFDCYFDSSLEWASMSRSSEWASVNCKVQQKPNGFVELQSSKGGIAIMDLESVQRNLISIDVELLFSKGESNSNAFIIFGDDPLYTSRICVGVYGSKNELWIEEHSKDVYALKQVREKFETDSPAFKRGGVVKIIVNLNLKKITLTFGGQTISSRYENHLGGLRWLGYRVYNTRAQFGALKVSSLGNEGSI